MSGGVSDEVLLSLFRALAGLEEPLLVVIDDFHVVEDPQNLAAVADLVSHDVLVHLVLLIEVRSAAATAPAACQRQPDRDHRP